MRKDDTIELADIVATSPEPAPAQLSKEDQVLEELRSLGESVTPEEVVMFASNPDTALHSKFCWDDSIAAHAYRLQQARQLVRVYIQVMDTGRGREEPVRMFVSTPATDEGPRGYKLTKEVLQTKESRHTLVIAQLERIASILRSYPLPELQPVLTVVNKLRKQYSH
jgi:hypothetical protein